MNTRYTLQKLVWCFALLVISMESKAQFVTIPDANFATYLQTNFPSAMNGNQMDTTDVSITTEDTIIVSGLNIQDLSGLQYFDSLVVFNGSYNTLIAPVPDINSPLYTFFCQECNLSTLPALPSTVILLVVMDNNITALPVSLPPNLELLDINRNQVSSLPPLPNSITGLFIDSNPVSTLPILPSNLLTMSATSCQLTGLPNLPSSLMTLDVPNNNIFCLPLLPDGMQTLSAAGNPVACLPNKPTNPFFNSDIGYNICPLPGSYITTNVSCNGACDGSLSTSLGAPYTFLWSNGSTAPSQINLCAAPIYLVLTDPNACAYIDTFNIIQPAAISITTSTISATCGNADGSIILNVTGGVSPYQYSIDGGITFQVQDTFGNLVSGLYTVQVEDANGCFAFANAVVSSIGGPVIVNVSTTNVLCNGDTSGSIAINASGGTAPLNYSIDNGLSFQLSNTFSNLHAGNYNIVVVDIANCFTTSAAAITEPTQLIVSIASTTNVTCFGANDGSLTIVASGGTGTYTYAVNWGPFQPSNVLTNLAAGTYTIVVMDANGCTALTNATITEPQPITFPLTTNVTVCNGNPVLICVAPTGGTPAYNYLWSTSGFTNCELVTVSGVYSVTVTDINGCTASTSITVTYSTGWSFASVTNLILPTCGMCDGSAEIIMNNTQAVAYQWLPGNITTAINSQICDNVSNSVIVTDTAGCVDTVNFTLSCHSVWPGDANNDGQADNTDLLAIGIGYGTTGDPRENATIFWQSEKGFDWADSLASGTNYKHIDCNGDGIIADDDTIAIIQNFGLTHPLRQAFIPSSLTDPPLYFDIQIDSANVDTILQIPLMLGTAAIPADSVYGIAFTVSYDTALVKADSVTMNFINCWMNSATGHTIGIGVNDPLNGKLYGAVTRTSHTDTSGFGELGRFGVVTVDNISARMTSLYADTLILGISDVTLITHDEQYKTVNIIIDSLIINDNTVGLNEPTETFTLNVYPNPANRFLFIEYDEQVKNPILEMRNILSENQNINYRINNGKAIVDLSNVASGIYILTVKSEKGIVTRKINIQKQ